MISAHNMTTEAPFRRPLQYDILLFLLEEKLCYRCDVVTAVHPCVATAWIHGLVLNTSVLEVLLKLERRLIEEV